MTFPARTLAALLFAPLLLACACAAHNAPAPPAAPPAGPPREPKVALVLGGGAARGFAHIGVIRVLGEEKIPVSLVVGASAGSLVGGLYAAGAEPLDLEWTAFTIEKEDIFDFSLFGLWKGPVSGERIEQFVNRVAKVQNIEETKIPFRAVATELSTGRRVVLERGPLGRAVRASSAIPGVIQSVTIDGASLVDGGVVDPIPTDVARELGADIVLAVDIQRDLAPAQPTSALGVMLQTVEIMARKIGRASLAQADVVIAPKVGDVGSFDFSRKKETLAAGIAAAREAMPQVRAAIEAWRAKNPPPS